jgi:hypothetical protein
VKFLKKFIILYSDPSAVQAKMMQEGDQEAMMGEMEKWTAWFDKNKEAVTDMGTPLGDATKVNKEGGEKNQTWTTGYTLMQANSMDEVVEMLKDHPHLNMPGCEIQVYECLPVPGM